MDRLKVSSYRLPKTTWATVWQAVQGLKVHVVSEAPGRSSIKGPEVLTIGLCYARPRTHVTIRYNLEAIMKPVPRPKPVHVHIESLAKTLETIGLIQAVITPARCGFCAR